MPKRILVTILLIFPGAVTLAQNATLPVPTDLKAVLVPTMSPLPVVGLRWTAPDGPWKYRVFRSEGDSLHFHLLGLASSRAWFDPITTGPNTYFYQVRTCAEMDSQIVESGPSNTAWLTIGPLPPRPTGAIAGTVGDDGTHLPIPFAIVRFFRQGMNITIYPPPSVLADSLGRYRAVLDTGMYLVRADGIGIPTFAAVLYRPEWYDNVTDISQATPVPVTPGSEFTANFSLTRLLPPKVVAIEGAVTNDVGNTDRPTVPLAGATVAILRPIQAMNSPSVLPASSAMAGGDGAEVDGLGYCAGLVWKGRTDSTGHYRASVFSGYSYVAVAAKRGYLPEYYREKTNPLQADLIKADGDLTGIDFTLAPNPVLQNSVSGTVRDSLGTGVPSRIVLFPCSSSPMIRALMFGHTDSTGAYALRDVRAGKYLVLAVPFRGYAPAFYSRGEYGVRCWRDADTVAVSGAVTGIDIGVRPIVPRGAVIVAGQVVDGAGLPLDGVRVFALSSDGGIIGFSVTDNAGSFSVEGLASIPMTLAFDREGYEPGLKQFTPAEGEFVASIGTVSMSAAVTESTSPPPRAPAAYALYPNYPNPFNPSTTIRFDLPVAGVARIVIYNILGQEIARLQDGFASAGTHSVMWDGRDSRGKAVAGGLYLVRFAAFNASGTQQYLQMRKIVLVK